MATLKQRITVSLSDHQYKVVSTIAKLGGGSMSGFIGELLESALPTLERMAVTFQKVKDAQDAERGRFLESMDRAQTALEPAVNNAVGQFDLFLARLESAVEDATGDAAGIPVGASAAGRHAPPTNRGATSKRKTSGKPSAATVSAGFSKTKILKKGGAKKS